jgi:hypothetical protein
MSYFYKYKFVSPEPLFARVKEEMKSYFDSNAVDDLMFPIWTSKCLQKLGRSSYKIVQALLFMDNFEAKLPPDYEAAREVWMTAQMLSPIYRKPGAFYQQITTVLNKPYDPCNQEVNCDPCNPDIITVVAKTQTEVTQPIRLKYLLTPGNIHAKQGCDLGCMNVNARTFGLCKEDMTFDIRDGKLITNFREGDVYLIYYSSQRDDAGYQLIPDNYRIQEFIEAFLKQKIFEQLYNQITDETFNQIREKYMFYKQLSDEAYILADIEIKKKTIFEKAQGIRRDQHRFDPYTAMMYGNSWRWRGGSWPASSWGLNQ